MQLQPLLDSQVNSSVRENTIIISATIIAPERRVRLAEAPQEEQEVHEGGGHHQQHGLNSERTAIQ